MARPDPLAGFEREVHTVYGVKTPCLGRRNTVSSSLSTQASANPATIPD